MRKIVEYRKIMGADKDISLSDLKTLYRNFMKEFHPDKFQDEEQKIQAEEKSKLIIEAYHTLVSIAAETRASNLETYNKTISACGIADISYKGKRLRIEFADGSAYEYIGVPENTYAKFVNADSQARFARRHICHAFLYRQVSKTAVAA